MSPTERSSPHPSPAYPSFATGKLPPLPKIRSRGIRKRVFTHSSLAGENRYDFQAPQSDPSTDNEELGQIGDQVFALAITDLIQKLYPHLRVGYASKVRDRIKRKSLIAEICVGYELHKVVNLPERQAESLRATQSVQVNVFKAYVGGLFREQGLEVVTKWLYSVFIPHVEDAYQYFRNDYYLVPSPQAVLQPQVPTASYPSPPSSMVSESVRPGLSSRPTVEHHRSPPPRTNGPQQGSGRVVGSMGNRPEVIDQSSSKRRRRRSSQMDNRRGDTDDTRSQHRRTGSDRSETETRKRTRYGEAGHV